MHDAVQQLGGTIIDAISKLDLRDAFHTLGLSADSMQYCGITPFYGSPTYLYQRLAMGLSVSPAVWMEFATRIMEDLPDKNHHIIIMDDVLVHSKLKDHSKQIEDLFVVILKHGLKISPRKCQFFMKTLDYMGHTIEVVDRQTCICAHKDRKDAICKLNQPVNGRDCRGFCGMVNFLAIYLACLQILLIPIYEMSRKLCKFEWTEACQKAFVEIKELVTNSPVLAMPNRNGLFHIYADTSIISCGATQTKA